MKVVTTIALISVFAFTSTALGQGLTFAQRRAARQEAREANYARYAASKQARIQSAYTQGYAGGGCNGAPPQLYMGGGCNGAPPPVQNGCNGGTVQYIQAPAPAPVQYVQAQPAPVAAPAPEGVRMNIQYYLPAPQVENGNMQIPAPTTQAPACPTCPTCVPSQRYKYYSSRAYVNIPATQRR